MLYGSSGWSADVISADAGQPGVPGRPTPETLFGTPASGDFYRYGYAYLAVGVPGESVGTRAGAGGVQVLYGSRARAAEQGSRFFSQATRGLPRDRAGRRPVRGRVWWRETSTHAGHLRRDAPDPHGPGPEPPRLGAPRSAAPRRADDEAAPQQKFDSEVLIAYGGRFRELQPGRRGRRRTDATSSPSGVVLLAILVGSRKGLTTESAQVWDDAAVGIGRSSQGRPDQRRTFGDFDGDHHADLAVGSLGRTSATTTPTTAP